MMTPVYFGSALNNFGVKEILDQITKVAPGPMSREVALAPYDSESPRKTIEPSNEKFSGFVFKIQANMDKRHRDRIAFMRVCSGKFIRNEKIFHVRSGKEIRIPTPLIFQAQDREVTEYALPGDIIGLHDSGKYQIGDTFTEGENFQYTGIPSFAPEIFQKVLLKDPMKGKQLETGLRQLSEEGTVQLFVRHGLNDKILGAVGMLQFEVVKYRLEDEYNVHADYQAYPFTGVRWLKFPTELIKNNFIGNYSSSICYDHKNRMCFAIKSEWDLKLAIEKNPEVKFFKNSDYK
jgi:peptide chain release factor 3